MKRWTSIAILSAVAMLAVAILEPAPARADTEDVLLWSAVGAGAAIVIVLVAVWFTRDEDAMFLTEPPTDPRQTEESRIHFGPECVKPDGSAALLCW